MAHYVGIVEEEDGKAVGVWFPDLPGCFSAGETVEDAMINAREALTLWADVLADRGRQMPPPRTVVELRSDPEAAADLKSFMIALIPFEPALRAAAAE